MRATAQALHDFFSGFGIPAYMKGSIPDDVTVPYLTYPMNEPEWDQKATFYVQGWYRTTSNVELAEKADEILQAIGVGITLKTASGYLVIYPETPLVQFLTDGDFRSFYINLSINVYQMPGAYPVTPGQTPAEPGT